MFVCLFFEKLNSSGSDRSGGFSQQVISTVFTETLGPSGMPAPFFLVFVCWLVNIQATVRALANRF